LELIEIIEIESFLTDLFKKMEGMFLKCSELQHILQLTE